MSHAIEKLNEILDGLSIPVPLNSIDNIPSSLWVAVFERLLETRVQASEGISSVTTISFIIRVLSDMLDADLSHIIPNDVFQSQPKACTFLAEIFYEIFKVLRPSSLPSPYQVEQEFLGDVSSIAKIDDVGDSLDVSFEFQAQELAEPSRREQSPPKRVRVEGEASQVARKRLKMENVNSMDTPERRSGPLDVLDTDTPHLKALKRRQKQLQARQRIEKSSTSKQDIRRPGSRSSIRIAAATQGKRIFLPANKPLAVQNFHAFQSGIKDRLPAVEIDQRITDRTWKGQIGIWKHALNDRLWSRTVRRTKDDMASTRESRVEAFQQKQLATRDRLTNLKRSQAANHAAYTELRERERAVLRMSNRQREAETYVDNAITRKRLENDHLLAKTHKEYLKAQRSAIIRERREQDKQRRQETAEIEKKRENRKFYLQDQIKMLQEELDEANREQEIAEKARIRERRGEVREQREKVKSDIGRIREKLAVDLDNAAYTERELERIRDDIQFRVVERRG
ncbi:MAG: hypothetical protein SGCHY_002494 [Lobulomycetales sp.]